MKFVSLDSVLLKPLRRIAAPSLLALLLAASLFAGEPYVDPTQIDGIALLPPPPAAGSAEQVADLASARAVFKGRTQAEEARAFKDENLSIYNFAPAIGDFFKHGKFPKVDTLFRNVRTNISEVINTPKDHWHRARPYQVDSSLKLGRLEPSFSYPSGHSTRGTVYSLIMAELFPAKRDGILEIGRNIGWDRVIMGKHFPTDVFAGRVLGQAIMRELMKSPAFQHDLAEAKAEVEAAQVTETPAK